MWREMQGLDLEAYNLAARATRLSSHLSHLSHASHSASDLTILTYFSLKYFSVLASQSPPDLTPFSSYQSSIDKQTPASPPV